MLERLFVALEETFTPQPILTWNYKFRQKFSGENFSKISPKGMIFMLKISFLVPEEFLSSFSYLSALHLKNFWNFITNFKQLRLASYSPSHSVRIIIIHNLCKRILMRLLSRVCELRLSDFKRVESEREVRNNSIFKVQDLLLYKLDYSRGFPM